MDSWWNRNFHFTSELQKSVDMCNSSAYSNAACCCVDLPVMVFIWDPWVAHVFHLHLHLRSLELFFVGIHKIFFFSTLYFISFGILKYKNHHQINYWVGTQMSYFVVLPPFSTYLITSIITKFDLHLDCICIYFITFCILWCAEMGFVCDAGWTHFCVCLWNFLCKAVWKEALLSLREYRCKESENRILVKFLPGIILTRMHDAGINSGNA